MPYNKRSVLNLIAIILLSTITILSVILSSICKYDYSNFANYEPDFLLFALFFALVYFYLKALRLPKTKHKIVRSLFALLFAIQSVALIEINTYGRFFTLFTSPVKIILFLFCTIGYFTFYYYIISTIHYIWNKKTSIFINSNLSSNRNIEKQTYNGKEQNKSLFFSIVILILWLPFWICIFPGTIQYDAGTMLKQVYGNMELSNNNPIFQTALLWLFTRIGEFFASDTLSVALYTSIQAFLLALVLGSSINILYKNNASKLVITISILFCTLLPIFPSYAFSLGKDTPFGIAIIWYSLMIFKLIDNYQDFILHKKNIVFLMLSALLTCLLRNVGIYLVLSTWIVISSYMLIKYRKKALYAVIPIFTAIIINIVFVNVIIPAYNIQPEGRDANLSIPLQQVARVLTIKGEDSLTIDEHEAVSAVLELENIASKYDPEFSDYVKFAFKQDCSDDQLSAFYTVWKSMAVKYPAIYAEAVFYNSFGYFLPGYIYSGKPRLFWDYHYIEPIQDVFTPMPHSSLKTLAKAAVNILERIPPLGFAMTCGFIQWFNIICFILILITKQKKYSIVLLPAIFIGIGLIASPVNAYLRYILPCLYAIPLSLACLWASIKQK